MSRIHDALKKAEQERSNVHATDTSAPSQETMAPRPATSIARNGSSLGEADGTVMSRASTVGGQTAVMEPPLSDHLRFDELRSRCAHPVWHPDPNVNVFGNATLSPHAAEQFRTLRSRLYQLRSAQNLKTLLMTSSIPGEGKDLRDNEPGAGARPPA